MFTKVSRLGKSAPWAELMSSSDVATSAKHLRPAILGSHPKECGKSSENTKALQRGHRVLSLRCSEGMQTPMHSQSSTFVENYLFRE